MRIQCRGEVKQDGDQGAAGLNDSEMNQPGVWETDSGFLGEVEKWEGSPSPGLEPWGQEAKSTAVSQQELASDTAPPGHRGHSHQEGPPPASVLATWFLQNTA